MPNASASSVHPAGNDRLQIDRNQLWATPIAGCHAGFQDSWPATTEQPPSFFEVGGGGVTGMPGTDLSVFWNQDPQIFDPLPDPGDLTPTTFGPSAEPCSAQELTSPADPTPARMDPPLSDSAAGEPDETAMVDYESDPGGAIADQASTASAGPKPRGTTTPETGSSDNGRERPTAESTKGSRSRSSAQGAGDRDDAEANRGKPSDSVNAKERAVSTEGGKTQKRARFSSDRAPETGSGVKGDRAESRAADRSTSPSGKTNAAPGSAVRGRATTGGSEPVQMLAGRVHGGSAPGAPSAGTARAVPAQSSGPAPSFTAPAEAMSPQVVRGMMALMNTNGGVMTMRLQPDTLGALRINMQMIRGQVNIQLLAETAATRDLLQNTLDTLRASLESRGLKVESMSVQPLVRPHSAGPTANGTGADDGNPQGQHGRDDSEAEHDAGGARSRGFTGDPGRRRPGGRMLDQTFSVARSAEGTGSSSPENIVDRPGAEETSTPAEQSRRAG